MYSFLWTVPNLFYWWHHHVTLGIFVSKLLDAKLSKILSVYWRMWLYQSDDFLVLIYEFLNSAKFSGTVIFGRTPHWFWPQGARQMVKILFDLRIRPDLGCRKHIFYLYPRVHLTYHPKWWLNDVILPVVVWYSICHTRHCSTIYIVPQIVLIVCRL